MTKPFTLTRFITLGFVGLAVPLFFCLQAQTSAQQAGRQPVASPPSSSAADAVTPASEPRRLLDRYCVTCHNERLKTADLRLDRIDVANPGAEPEIWEKVVRKVHTGTMPPPNMPQLSQDDRRALLTWLETSLDAASAAAPNPGRTETLRRLNRTEYQNAVRDLLALDIDAGSLLPSDESGHGFDNVTVGDLPPTLLDRYISAAQKISRLAVGSTQSSLQADTIRLPADLTQEDHVPGLPIGTRGGASIPYTFAQDGEYDIQMWLARDLSGSVGGLREARPHQLVLLLDREPVKTFTIEKPADSDDTLLDKDLKARVTVPAGPHDIGVTFVQEGSSLVETAKQPLQSHFNERRHPRTGPAINQVSVTGPYAAKGAENTPSRRRLFVCQPTESGERRSVREDDCHHADAARVSPADLEHRRRGADGVLSRGTGRGRFRCRNRTGVERRAHQPGVPVPRRDRAEERRRPATRTASAISSSHRGSRSSCGAAFPDDELLDVADSRQAQPARGAREADAQNARRSALVEPRDQLRRTVAAAAQSRRRHSEHASVPGLRRQRAPGVPAGNRALSRQRGARGSQRARFDQDGLHLPQRAPREALRHSRTSTAAASAA